MGIMSKTSTWLLVIGVLLIFALVGWGLVTVVGKAAQTTLNPVQQVVGELSTQVAKVLNPTPTVIPDPLTIVHEVRTLARLETIQYSLEKVITAESGQGPLGFLFGDRLLFIAHGQVIAGVDLAKLSPEDMWVQNRVLYVRLPEPEVFVATLDNENSYVYDRDTGVFTKGSVDLETEARKAAVDEMLDSALEDGILEQARINAENYLWRLLRDLGYPEVIFVESTATPES